MKRISQRDIAKKLGVNVSTVSRALRGIGGVSADVRQRIERFAEEHGYRPNLFATSLGYDYTHLIGIVVPDVSFSQYAHIVKRIEAEAKKVGFMCIVTDSGDQYEKEVECIELLMNMHVEGIILCLAQKTTDYSHLLRVKEHHIPIVLFDRAADIDISSVIINDVDSARQVTHYLINEGARRIAFLGGSNQMKQTADRKHGYLEALRERNIPIRKELVKCHDASINSGLSDTLELLSLPKPPDAIIASHGMLAIAAYQTIMSQNLRIPEDIALVGYMSGWVSDMTTPRMSFVKQNLREIGSKAFKLLYDQINGDNLVRRMVVKARLEIRDSTRKNN
jgi:LacI family transcriptional regulator